MELQGISYLRRKLAQKRERVNLRYNYYEMKNRVRDLHISTPPGLENWFNSVGWCSKAVDTLADRVVFRTFANDNFDMMGIFNQNNPDVLFDSAVLSALISGCSFIYISNDEDGFPRLQVIDGGNATGIIDPYTGLLTEGYAVLERDVKTNKPILEAYFIPGETVYYEKGKDPISYTYNVPYPLLVPIIYRPDAKRPFGHSRISRACMDIQASAARVIKRGEISGEFYSFPQKYAVGLAEDVEMEKWSAAMSSFLAITSDSEGSEPKIGQFSQSSMTPHKEQLEMFASLFAGETGLTKDDLGFVSDNPSSQEAIKASHENLRLMAKKAQRSFGTGFLNVGYLAACLRDDYAYTRNQVYLTSCKWEPIFEPDASTLSLIGDGVIKINQAIPGYMGSDNLRDLTGIPGDGESNE